jgi:hypothetical protein
LQKIKSSEFHSKPFHRIEKHSELCNFVPNYHSSEDKKCSIHRISFQTKMQKKHFGNVFRTKKTHGLLFKKLFIFACDSLCTCMVPFIYEKSFGCCYVVCSIKPHLFGEFHPVTFHSEPRFGLFREYLFCRKTVPRPRLFRRNFWNKISMAPLYPSPSLPSEVCLSLCGSHYTI